MLVNGNNDDEGDDYDEKEVEEDGEEVEEEEEEEVIMGRLLQSCKSSVHPPKALSAGIIVVIIVSIMLIMMNEVDNKTMIIKTVMVAQLSVSLLQVMSGDPVGCYLLLLEKRNWHMSWLDPLCLCQCQYCQYRWQILHWIT